MLGFYCRSTFGPGVTPINNYTVQTGGSLNCSLITDGSCDHSMDLGVVCRTNDQFLGWAACFDNYVLGILTVCTVMYHSGG